MIKGILAFLVFSVFMFFDCRAQSFPTDPETNKIIFQETISLDSLSQATLYQRSKDWMTDYYKSNKFDFDDKENFKTGIEGYFVITMLYDFKYKNNYNVTYNITLAQKEGKYRYSLTDFMIYDVKNGAKTAQGVEGF